MKTGDKVSTGDAEFPAGTIVQVLADTESYVIEHRHNGVVMQRQTFRADQLTPADSPA